MGTPTFAERLGWPEGTRALVVHADDAGLSLASNEAIVETVGAGTVTSLSTMLPCSWVPHLNAWLADHPEVCAGVHLTLTAEWTPYKWAPVAGRDAVPGLVNDEGWMHASAAEVVEYATPAEVETEIRAQVALAERMGHPVTHLDSHMGVVYDSPDFFERYATVAIEKGIPPLMAGGHLTRAAAGTDRATELREHAPRVWNAGLPVLDDVDTRSYSWDADEKVDEFVGMLRDLPEGVTWFNVHPTRPTGEARTITGSREHLLGDYDALLDPRVREAIEAEGVVLTSWRELTERRRRVGDSIRL